jgi:hypothetical protein
MKKQQLRHIKKQNLLIMYAWPLFLFACLYSMPPQPSPQQTTPTTGPETVESIEKIGVQGNWVKKRDWLIKANEVNNEIQEITVQIEPVRKLYMEKQNEIDEILDAYYKQLGVDEGKVQELFDSILRYLDKKRKKDVATLVPQEGDQKDPDLQAKIDVLEESIRTSKQQLEQLKLDMKSIEDLDRSLADRIKRMDEYINKIHEDANRAKVLTNEMWNIIDHNKARANYYELKNAILEKLKSIQTYLKDDLFKDYESVIETIKKQIDITQDQIKKLETDGIFIKNRSQRIEALKLKELQLKREEAERTTKLPATAEKAAGTATWQETLYNYWTQITQKFFDAWKWITTKVLGSDTSTTPTSKTAQQQPTTPTTQATPPQEQPITPQATLPVTAPTSIPTSSTTPSMPTQEPATPPMSAQEATAQAMPSA